MNATFAVTVTARSAALCCLGAALLLGPAAVAKPTAHKPATQTSTAQKPAAPKPPPVSPAPTPVAAAPTPAVALVRQYLDARAQGQAERAYALLSPETQANYPADHREEIARQLTGPDMLRTLPPGVLPVVALFADIHDALHFRFRALGPSPDDPAIVLVRAYQVGTPLSTVKTLQVATVADAGAGGALRLDGIKTITLAAPEMMQKARQATSQSNLKQLSLGIIQYIQDNDMKLPDADKWADEILPYVKNEAVFRDPAAPDLKYGYAFNRALSGVLMTTLEDPAATVLLFESTAGKKNAADTGASVPMPGRHNGGTDYALADGHVKWEADGTRPSFLTTGK